MEGFLSSTASKGVDYCESSSSYWLFSLHKLSSSPLQFLGLSRTEFFLENFPDSIGKDLYADNCKFYRSVPTCLGNLTQITELDLSDNNFSGTLPSSLSNLRNLTDLDLLNNKFIGPFTLSYVRCIQ